MTEYTIIIEDAGSNFAAHAPDVPGCVDAAKTVEETRTLMEEALELHIEILREMGEEIPEPNSQAATFRVAS
jgi:predicted RNase H-like HicB family nuclease